MGVRWCRDCRRTFNQRTSTPFNYLQFPTDIVLLVVMWRLRYKLNLRDLAEMFLERGFEFTHKAVRDWEAYFTPVIADKRRTKRKGQVGRSWYVDETYIKVAGSMKPFITWVGTALVLMVWMSSVAVASCAPPEPPQQNLQHSDAVFSGEVMSVGTPTIVSDLVGWDYPVTFRGLEAWKGVSQPTVVLKGQARTSVAFPFEQGERYLVYAYHEGDIQTGPLTTNSCKGTKRLTDAHADLQVLGPGSIVLEEAVAAETNGFMVPIVLSGILLFMVGMVFIVWHRHRQV